MSLYTFTEDPEWVKLGFRSFDVFEKQFAPKFRWDKNVHEDVRKQFRTIRNLLLHSFYEADFVDVAYFESMLSLEMSLSLRYTELEGQPKSEKSFGQLMKWANKTGLLDLSTDAVNSIIDQRNDVLHPKKWRSYGPLAKFVFSNFELVINGLYDSIELRRRRKNEERRISKLLKSFEVPGAVLRYDSTKRIIHRARLALFNNWVTPNEYTIAFYPAPESQIDLKYVTIASPITFKVNEVLITAKKLNLVTTPIVIATVQPAEEKELLLLTQFREILSKDGPFSFRIKSELDFEESKALAALLDKRDLNERILDPPSPENGILEEPSQIWVRFQNIKTFEQFCDKVVTEFKWYGEVGIDVRKAFEVIQKLLYHSFYVFEFIQVAYKQAIFGFEMALAIRFSEVEGNEKTSDMSLQDLISWAQGKGLLEANQVQLKAIAKIRDSLAHPDKWTLNGFNPLKTFPIINVMINDLYEDPCLRRERKDTMNEVNRKLVELADRGAVLTTPEMRLIMYKCSLVHHDNRKKERFYVFVFWPIFKPEFDEKNELNEGSPIIVEAKTINWNHDSFETTTEREKYCLSPISNETNQKRFDEFRKALKNEDASSAIAMIDFEIARIANQIHYERMLQRIE